MKERYMDFIYENLLNDDKKDIKSIMKPRPQPQPPTKKEILSLLQNIRHPQNLQSFDVLILKREDYDEYINLFREKHKSINDKSGVYNVIYSYLVYIIIRYDILKYLYIFSPVSTIHRKISCQIVDVFSDDRLNELNNLILFKECEDHDYYNNMDVKSPIQQFLSEHNTSIPPLLKFNINLYIPDYFLEYCDKIDNMVKNNNCYSFSWNNFSFIEYYPESQNASIKIPTAQKFRRINLLIDHNNIPREKIGLPIVHLYYDSEYDKFYSGYEEVLELARALYDKVNVKTFAIAFGTIFYKVNKKLYFLNGGIQPYEVLYTVDLLRRKDSLYIRIVPFSTYYDHNKNEIIFDENVDFEYIENEIKNF